MIVRRHGQGIFSAPARARTIGLLFGMDPFRVACSPFYHLLIDAIGRQSAERDYQLETYVDLAYFRTHAAILRRLQRDIAEGRVQGLLLPVVRQEQWEWAQKQGIPFVGGGGPTMRGGWGVGYDFSLMVEILVGKLADQGCRRIGLISHPLSPGGVDVVGRNDVAAFSRAMERRGLEAKPRWIIQTSRLTLGVSDPVAITHEETGFRLGKRMAADRADLPQGLVIADDMLARGVLTALARAGVQVGRDIQVATHVNRGSSALMAFERNLIRAELDPADLARGMIQTLEALMDGKQPKSRLLLIPPVRILTAQE